MKNTTSAFSIRGDRGYTLLFAVLTATLVLGVAVFILNVSRRQYILSATARDSMYAIYAADSGLECAINSGIASNTPGTANIFCAGSSTQVPAFSAAAVGDATVTRYSEFVIPLPDVSGANSIECADIKVSTYLDGFNRPTTKIESRGYNLCSQTAGTVTPNSGSPRTVERGLRLTTSGW